MFEVACVPGLEDTTFGIRVQRSNQNTIPGTYEFRDTRKNREHSKVYGALDSMSVMA